MQPSARGRGLGASLLRNAVDECRRRGIESIELRVTPDDRELGIPDFYTKQGFCHRGLQIYGVLRGVGSSDPTRGVA